ncbi:MAG TPA: LacI family DNA-binding transcriptional regulator [Anaerolineae bacterium]|nr:LacI family DNA-binding transcriptional regulator [Anaerolineae bacterium]
MTTIRDIAKKANVSVTAVSYALNNTGTLSAETRQRILQVAEELNYHPNAFARHLKKRQTHTLGVFISSFGGQFYEDILEGIHQTLLQTEYEMLVCPQARALRKILTQRQVDGAIVFDSTVESDLLLKLVAPDFPIVVMDRYFENDFLLPLLLDNRAGTQEAFYHLYDQGFRDIAFVAGVAHNFDNTERQQTFLAEAARNGLDVPVYQGDFVESSGYQIATQLLHEGTLPEAVFCANDQMAIGFIKAVQEHALRVPEDVAVVGFDDILTARIMRPTLSTIGAPRFEWGAQAAAQLVAYLEHAAPFAPQRLPTHLIVRESSVRIPPPSPQPS